ncbi:hypothetical protein FRC02_002485 [Tulasnella sp. 418]|nr:hypothetical protein FRC02_002485 [Tulasnella sp. 418]
MEVSAIKNKEWIKWWPEAMKLYPGVLSFLPHIELEDVLLKDILRVFSRLLPDDWQYDDIQEALQSEQSRNLFPQLHILDPGFHTLFPDGPSYEVNVVELTLRSFQNSSSKFSEPDLAVQDAVVELLGWMVAYPDSHHHLPQCINQNQSYEHIPPFLISVMGEKKTANTSMPVPPKAIEERNRMIGRHAARHLRALAFLNAETNGERASLVKLKSLLLIIRNMELIHHWFEDGEANAHGQGKVKGVNLRRIVTTSYDFFLGRGHSIQQEVRRHHTSDLALEGMMKIWQDSKASSPEMKFLCREETIRDLVTYLEKHPSLEGLLSSETDVIKTTFNYLNEARRYGSSTMVQVIQPY